MIGLRLAGCLLIVACAAVRTPASKANPAIVVTVTGQCRAADACTLNVSLANKSDRSVQLYKDLLPWRRYGMLLVAAEARPMGATLKPRMPIDDPGGDIVTIAPGETISGNLSLSDYFPELAAQLARSDVAVFWAYRPVGRELEKAEYSNGALLLPLMAEALK